LGVSLDRNFEKERQMSDPRYREDPMPVRHPPGTNPPRYPTDLSSKADLIAAAAVAAVLVIGLFVWSMGSHDNTADKTPADQTTAQSDRSSTPANKANPANPLPANPNATTPQREPAPLRQQ
jgi:hypothetical protein